MALFVSVDEWFGPELTHARPTRPAHEGTEDTGYTLQDITLLTCYS